MRFNDTEITAETIIQTRQHFADICQSCIDCAIEYDSIPRDQLPDGKFFVNDLADYVVKEQQKALDFLAGKKDFSFTFAQRAYWLQTGEMIALLS